MPLYFESQPNNTHQEDTHTNAQWFESFPQFIYIMNVESATHAVFTPLVATFFARYVRIATWNPELQLSVLFLTEINEPTTHMTEQILKWYIWFGTVCSAPKCKLQYFLVCIVFWWLFSLSSRFLSPFASHSMLHLTTFVHSSVCRFHCSFVSRFFPLGWMVISSSFHFICHTLVLRYIDSLTRNPGKSIFYVVGFVVNIRINHLPDKFGLLKK